MKTKLRLGVMALAGALVVAASAAGVSARTHAASCSTAAASAAATAAGFDVDPGLGRTPVNSVICGPFFGAGSQGMAATVAIPTGCGFSIGWAAFRADGANWRLLFKYDNGILKPETVPLADGGADIRITQGYPRRGDPRCSPSRYRSQVWHWNGSTFTASPWRVTAAPTVYYRHFRSPNGNLACEFGPGQVPGVECVTLKPARLVSLDHPAGRAWRVFICRTYGDRCLFSVKIFSDGSRITSAPVLHHGQQAVGTGLGAGTTCVSQAAGITCRIRSGLGFLISNGGIKRIT